MKARQASRGATMISPTIEQQLHQHLAGMPITQQRQMLEYAHRGLKNANRFANLTHTTDGILKDFWHS